MCFASFRCEINMWEIIHNWIFVEININRGVGSYLKLGGQVIMRFTATATSTAAASAFYSAKTWMDNCPLCPSNIWSTPDKCWKVFTFYWFLSRGPLKWVHPIIFATNVFHNSFLIQKCIQNQQLLLILYTLLNQKRIR